MGGGWKAILKVKMSSECRKQELLYDRVTSNNQYAGATSKQATSDKQHKRERGLLSTSNIILQQYHS